MYVKRKIAFSIIFRFAWKNLLKFTLWAIFITFAYTFFILYGINISIPFLPLSTIGIAVAFYVGFKNSQSYDRLWEARKIWGGIVNNSRIWANQVMSYVTRKHAVSDISDEELHKIRKKLIYRHIAWTNALRTQLRKTTIFDRENLSHTPDFKLKNDPVCNNEIGFFLNKSEFENYINKSNPATHIIRKQSEDLRELMEESGLIEDFRHMEMMRILEELYNLQGMCERIKNTPFPRQYAYFSTLFVWIFVFLLPFGLVGEFAQLGSDAMLWLTVPFSVLISWVFLTMEIVGDNSEDPFENYINK